MKCWNVKRSIFKGEKTKGNEVELKAGQLHRASSPQPFFYQNI